MKNKKQHIYIVTHSMTYKGNTYSPMVNILKENLDIGFSNKIPYSVISHNFTNPLHTRIDKNKSESIVVKNKFIKNLFFKVLAEFYITWNQLKINDASINKVCIAINPLSCFYCVILKKLNIVNYVVHFAPDYSEIRYENFLINKIYKVIDFISNQYCDEIWASHNVMKKRISLGFSKDKIHETPLIPYISNYKYNLEKKYVKNYLPTYKLVFVSYISEQCGLVEILDAMSYLINDYPSISLSVVGDGDKLDFFKSYASNKNLEDRVKFYGYVDRENVFSIIRSSDIGLAIYTGKWGHNNYGDSVKARDYISQNKPVILSNNNSTVFDIKKYKMGLILKDHSAIEISSHIKKIYEDYYYYSKNSLDYYYNIKDIYIDRINRIINNI